MRAALAHVALLVVLAVAVGAGFHGIDFGVQWDEPAVVREVQDSVETGLLLPRLYIYPSLRYDIALLALVPDVVRAGIAHADKFGSGSRRFGAAVKQELREVTASHAFWLRLRRVFFLASLTTAVFTYVAVFVWRRRWSEALLGASLVALSWEVHYQIRWIGPDGVMMAASALTLLFLTLAWRDDRARWIFAAAVAAGVGCSAKYPLALLLAPALALVALAEHESWEGVRRRLAIKATLAFVATYLALTPGTLLEPWRFAGDIMGIVSTYQVGKHPNYAVAAGAEHLWLNGRYLAETLFSPYVVVSGAITVAALAGAVAIARGGWRVAIVFFAFPVLCLLFLSMQRIMVVRNLLPLAPFLAVMAARGVTTAIDAGARVRWAGPAAAAVATAVLAVNAAWIVTAARSIPGRERVDWSAEARRYIEARPTVRFAVSPRVAEGIGKAGALPPNAVRESTAERIIFYASEADRLAMPGNRRSTYALLPSGPFEVNFDFYPHWVGFDRIVVVDPETARRARAVTAASGAGVR